MWLYVFLQIICGLVVVSNKVTKIGWNKKTINNFYLESASKDIVEILF